MKDQSRTSAQTTFSDNPPVAPGPDYDPGCEAITSTGGRCNNHPAQFFVDLGNGQLGRRCGLCLDGIPFLTGARHLIASGVDREKVLRHCVWTCVGPKGVPSL